MNRISSACQRVQKTGKVNFRAQQKDQDGMGNSEEGNVARADDLQFPLRLPITVVFSRKRPRIQAKNAAIRTHSAAPTTMNKQRGGEFLNRSFCVLSNSSQRVSQRCSSAALIHVRQALAWGSAPTDLPPEFIPLLKLGSGRTWQAVMACPWSQNTRSDTREHPR